MTTERPSDPMPPAQREDSGPLESAIAALRKGEMIVVHDGTRCIVAAPAAGISIADVNALITYGGGVLGAVISSERAEALQLEPMGASRGGTTAMVSVDSLEGTTGISAADRTATLHALCAERGDGRLVTPGHVFPQSVRFDAVEPTFYAACVALAHEAGVIPVIAVVQALDSRGEPIGPERIRTLPGLAAATAVSTLEVLAYRRGLHAVRRCDPDDFRQAMSRLVSGVAGITVRDRQASLPKGMLATSVTSYTDDPPSVLVCVSHKSRTHDPLVEAPGFGLHLLGDGHGQLAEVLASRSEDKFAAIEWGWDGDVPRIRGVPNYIRCSKSASFTHLDHSIIIGEVEVVEHAGATPLVYFQRGFDWHLVQSEETSNPASAVARD